MNTNALARDSLKSKQTVKENSQLFGVLYDFLLFAAIPVAFEMSFVKIFQNSMKAYLVNDVEAMGRLIIYFAVQWFLGVLVRRKYLKSGLKRLTLVVMIIVQVKEAFVEEVLVDMVISIILESGFAVLLFLKFAHLVVILQLMGLCFIIFSAAIYVKRRQLFQQSKSYLQKLMIQTGTLMHRIQHCMRINIWHRDKYSYCSYQHTLA
jgi:hypothetical protein